MVLLSKREEREKAAAAVVVEEQKLLSISFKLQEEREKHVDLDNKRIIDDVRQAAPLLLQISWVSVKVEKGHGRENSTALDDGSD